MTLTFTFVPPVASGDAVTSTQMATVADAFNDRLRCNAGDGCERIVFALFTQFRQFRNSDGGLTFPPQADFFVNFQNLKATDGQYPDGDPGDLDGANLACIANAFVFGNEALNLDSEDERIADPAVGGVPLWYDGGVPSDPEGIWELGKQQRGAVTENGALASPSFAAALQHYKIVAGPMSFHGNSYGGFMPTPVDLDDCADPGTGFGPPPDWQFFFTNLQDGTVRTYPGSCPEKPDNVASIARTPLWYVVTLNDGTQDVLPFDEWIEGPYAGGSAIKRNWGDFLPRALNAFANGFRGTPEERATQSTWLEFAFDREKFWASQYLLAPNIGTDAGGGIVNEVYPLFQASGSSLAAGTVLTHTQSGGSSHVYAEGFVLTGALIKTHRLSASCVVEFWDGITLLKSVTITPDGSGNAPTLVAFDPAVIEPDLVVKLPAGATFADGSGLITVETTELIGYKPQPQDLYLVLRLASCRTSLASGLDGSGDDETNSNLISDSYFANGCVLNSHGAPGPAGTFSGEVNSNAVFDAARRLSQFVHIVGRDGFLRYAVQDGKSICWFRRLNTLGMDQFDGIAPSREAVASGELVEGRDYVVRGGTITYNGDTIGVDQVFTATVVAEFTGDGQVYRREGILAEADPEGFTNEWLMGAQLKVYKNEEESIWKPDAYSDYYFLSERCHWLPNKGFGFPKDLKRQFDYGENFSAAPEAFSGWRYVHGTNAWGDCGGDPDCIQRKIDRYKSCRIYEPLPEIESATVDFESGVEVVKLVFKGRFHHCDAAPEGIAEDVNAWDIDALRAETYRTMENALREYLVLQDRGLNCTQGGANNGNQQGNSAYYHFEDVDPWTMDDLPWGACFPHFYFVKLFPKPWEDGNDVADALDTPLWADWWAQADLYLRGMCEGFVDGQTTTELACVNGDNAIFCYTFENLCFESHGRKSLTMMATQTTSLLTMVRPDGPTGYGQAPAISLAAECYNQVAGCLNLLNRVQIMLPQKFQTRTKSGTAEVDVAASWPPGSAPTCEVGGRPMGYYSGGVTDPDASAAGAWGDAFSAASSVVASIVPDACAGDAWIVRATRSDQEWRWALTDPDAFNALPEPWQGVFSDDGGEKVAAGGRVVAIQTTAIEALTVSTVDYCQSSVCSTESDGTCGDGRVHGYWIDPGGGYLRFDTDASEESTCVLLASEGLLHAPAVPSSIYPIGRDDIGGSCFGGPNTSLSLAPVFGDDMAFVEIPLV